MPKTSRGGFSRSLEVEIALNAKGYLFRKRSERLTEDAKPGTQFDISEFILGGIWEVWKLADCEKAVYFQGHCKQVTDGPIGKSVLFEVIGKPKTGGWSEWSSLF